MRRHAGFSILELLAVVTIVIILITVLIGTLGKARRLAQGTTCCNNLRQLAAAATSYSTANAGHFPAASNVNIELSYDFVYWQSDRITNVTTQSAFSPYLNWASAKPNKQVPATPTMYYLPSMLCPADDLTLNQLRAYPYSYVMNAYICGNAAPDSSSPPATSAFPLSKQVRVSVVYNASQKILFFEEDATTINDGSGNLDPTVTSPSLLSVQHDTGSPTNSLIPISDPHRGNVAFCDGHTEFITRDTSRNSHYFDPTLLP